MNDIEIPIERLTGDIKSHNADGEVIRSLCHDSRALKKGDWFIALKGENSDGHAYLNSVIENGAQGVIYESGAFGGNNGGTHDGAQDVSEILDRHRDVKKIEVEDTTVFLGKIAALWRDIINPRVIAVTGSNGKTSTKEITAFLLEQIYPGRVCYSRGNWNNHFGLPFSLLSLRAHHDFAVMELGSNHPGEIRYLSNMVRPDYAMVSSVAQGHIGNFGSLELIAGEKSDITAGMKEGGVLALSSSITLSKIFDQKAAERNVRVVYSDDVSDLIIKAAPNETANEAKKPQNEVSAPAAGTPFLFNNKRYFLPLAGGHQFANFRLVVSLLNSIQINNIRIEQSALEKAFERLAEMKNAPGRLAAREHAKFAVWDDSYNANPSSFEAAMEFVAGAAKEKNAAAYGAFGKMGELGDFTLEAHESLGRKAARLFDGVIFSAPEPDVREAFQRGWRSVTESALLITADSSDERLKSAAAELKEKMKPGDFLLVKGSRAAGMERTFAYL